MIPNVKLSTAQGDTQLGTALESDIDIWADNTSQDLDKDGLNDAWENAALEQLRPTFLYPDGEGLIENPADKVALFTRITPVEIETDSGEKATYVAFLNTAAYTQDYGAPDLGNATGGHSGDVSSFRTAWKVLDDDSTIELERLWTSGHVGTLRAHESYAIGVNGASSADSFLGPAEGPPIEFTEDGSMKLYIEEDKHSNWSSVIKHSMEGGSYPIGAKYAIRPDAYNVGEPWHHPSSTFYDDIGFLFKEEAIWNDPDNRFCGGLECDDAKTGGFLGSLFGSTLGAVVGGMLLGPLGAVGGGVAGGIYGSKYGKEIDGKSPTRLGDRFTDNAIDEFFPNNIRSGGDFYGGLSSDFAEPFILTINRVQTLDKDGLDGGTVGGRGDIYPKVSFDSDGVITYPSIQETDDLKGIGIKPTGSEEWIFNHVATGSVIDFTIQIWDKS